MMTECAAENRLSIVASDDSTDALLVTTSFRIDFDSTICSFLPSRVLAIFGVRDAVLHQQDHAAVGGDQLERLHDDLLEQQRRGSPRGRSSVPSSWARRSFS